MKFFKYSNGMASWYGMYEGTTVMDSINKDRFAIRQTDIGSGVYECYFPNPNDDDTCIHITDISREGIISILEDCDELDDFLKEHNLTEDDLRGETSIVALLVYIDESFDIVRFFELQDVNSLVYSKSEVNQTVLKSFKKVNRTQNTFFDELLRKRSLDRCPEYLWKLKITDDEYQELKDYIANKIRQNAKSNLYEREAALLFAEYHRREYGFRNTGDNNDNRPRALVFNSLGLYDIQNMDIDAFARIAGEGAERLGIQLYINNVGNTQYVFSLFYHGGLPLEKFSQNPAHPAWHRLIRYIIESDEPVDFSNFEELVTSVIANGIDALKAFCQELQNAILMNDYHMLPFFCSSENDPRFQMFWNMGQKAIAEIKSKKPFRIQWTFEVNMNQKVIRPRYSISGPDSISLGSEFINDNHLSEKDSFTVTCLEDGNELANIVYNRYQEQNDFYSNRSFSISSVYQDIKNISVRCPDLDNKVILSEELDIDSPQIIREQEDSEYYELTRNNTIGRNEVLVVVPDGWIINDEQNYTVDDGYDYHGREAKVITLPGGVENQSVILTDGNGNRKTISATVPLSKVVVMNRGISEYVSQSAFFNVKNLAYYIKRSDGGMRRIRDNLRFCSDRRRGEWLSEPPLGYIYVKSADQNNYADPVKILNLGNDSNQLRINYLNSDANSCTMTVKWECGSVSCPEGHYIDNAWHLNKKDLADSRFVTFRFEPILGNSFSLSIRTRFSDFQIYDEEGRPIINDCYISLADLPRYRYLIQDINLRINVRISELGFDTTNQRNANYTYAINTVGQFREKINVVITDNNNEKSFNNNNEKSFNRELRELYRESSLDHLFGGLKRIKGHFNRHQSDMLHTKIVVSANVNGRTLSFKIKKFPYIFEKNDQNEIEIKNYSDRQPVSYNGLVKAMPLNRFEDTKPVELLQSENGKYILTDQVTQWRDVLLYSGEREWVLPHHIDCTIAGEITRRHRDERFETIFFPMRDKEYPNAIIWDETWQRGCFWFEKAYKEHIPASSLFDLNAIMSSSKLMARFVFNMLLRGLKESNFGEYKVWLKRALLDMADDNSFLWIWVREDDCTFNNLGIENIDNNVLRDFLQGWYLYKQDYPNFTRLVKGELTDDEIISFIVDFINTEFTTFIKDLRLSSMDHFLEGNSRRITAQQLMASLNNISFKVPNYIDDNIDNLYYNPREEEIFDRFMNDEIRRRPENFRLFYKRAFLFFSAIRKNGTKDIFRYRPSVWKSVLNYTSYFKDLFIQLCIYKRY